MREITLDCLLLSGKTEEKRALCHDTLKKAFALPEYYGRNLDALHDCLTEPCEETVITLINADDPAVDAYGKTVIRVLCDCSRENDALTLKYKRRVEFFF